MTEEVTPMSTDLVIPFTGEVVSLEDPAQCAKVFGEIKELEYKLRELKGYLSRALMEASRLQGTKTLHYPGVDVKISTPNDLSWDYEILLELQDAGLPEERFNELVMTEITYKVQGNVAKQLSASNPVYAEIIERAKTQVPKLPSVSVSPTKV